MVLLNIDMTNRLCNGLHNGILIETDKSVRPCCAWEGQPLGSLETNTLDEILKGEQLTRFREMSLRNEWPDNCLECKRREETTGTSTRINVYNPRWFPARDNNEFTYLEFNSSNICNLVCVGCNPSWSSAWYKFRKDNNWPEFKGWQGRPIWNLHPARPSLINDFLKNTDWSNLKKLSLKGGEPFLNKENVLLLEHLDSLDLLKDIQITITTNGTIITDKFLNLLKKCKHVFFVISVDGLGELNQYIRFDPEYPYKSHTDNIKENIKKMLEIKNSWIWPAPAVQAHNIFSLEELNSWWTDTVYPIDSTRISKSILFTHFILGPEMCAVRSLTDATRYKLADYYESLNNPESYETVITHLRLDYLGDRAHNDFVRYTNDIDKTRLKKFLDLVPEASEELILLPVTK